MWINLDILASSGYCAKSRFATVRRTVSSEAKFDWKYGTELYDVPGYLWSMDENAWSYGVFVEFNNGDCDYYYIKNKWVKIDGKWYYFDSEGYAVTGSKEIDGKIYNFDQRGKCENPY